MLDDAVYGEVRPIGAFVQYEPDNGEPATETTEVWILYDDEHFYVAGKAYDDQYRRTSGAPGVGQRASVLRRVLQSR